MYIHTLIRIRRLVELRTRRHMEFRARVLNNMGKKMGTHTRTYQKLRKAHVTNDGKREEFIDNQQVTEIPENVIMDEKESELGTTISTVNITGDFSVIFIVTLPYSRSEFDAGTQQKYKAAMASVAATSADNVKIINITESRRRAGSVDVYKHILLGDAVKAGQMLEKLGEGEGLLQQINVGLEKQGLRASSAVSAPQARGLSPIFSIQVLNDDHSWY
jgi:hypothetical protein